MMRYPPVRSDIEMIIASRQHQGFTLIEVLVALVVLSIGILGVAGLQVKSQQYSRSAYLNTQATILAHDMIERMRANPQGLMGAGNAFYDKPAAKRHDSCYQLTGCSVQQMAENDSYEWRQDVSEKLPNGKAVVCIDSTPEDGAPKKPACDGSGRQYAVKVWWQNINGEEQRVITTVSF